jgi:hypothetical protein
MTPSGPRSGPHDASLAQAILRALQQHAGASYDLRWQGGRIVGESSVLEAALTIDPSGARLGARSDDPSRAALEIGVAAFGCAGNEAPLPAASAIEIGARNEGRLLRPGLVEWYVNGPVGLEQGFEVMRSAGTCAELRFVARRARGYRLDVAGDGGSVTARGDDGETWVVAAPYANDATGRPLSVRFVEAGDTYALAVDVQDAVFPVDVDPIFRREATLRGEERSGYFGLDVALHEETAVVGAYTDDVGAADWAGAAYVFRRTAATWALETRLTLPDAAAQDWFGWDVDIWRDTIAVSAMKDDTARGTDVGSVHVYTRSGSTWSRQGVIEPASVTRFGFGCGLSVHEDTVVVGHYGGPDRSGATTAYVYTRSGTTWSEQRRIVSASGRAFGRQVEVHGDVAVIADMMAAGEAGRVYVYRRTGTSWALEATLGASDESALDWFGYHIALDTDTIVVTAPGAWSLDFEPHDDRNFVFERVSGAWIQTDRRIMSDPSGRDHEWSVDVWNGWIVAGAAVLQRDGAGTWIAFDDVGLRDSYGTAIWNDTIIVGTRDAYTAEVFRLAEPVTLGAPCFRADECVSGQCVEGVCCSSPCSDACGSCLAARTGAAEGTCAPLRAGVAETVLCRSNELASCGLAEYCDPTSVLCPPDRHAVGTVCRASRGDCDPEEICSGLGAYCPADTLASAAVVCRGAAGPCDVEERCAGGVWCPADTFARDAPCRPATGPCDAAETCGGASASCPADRVRPRGAICDGSHDDCDLADSCDGVSVACPEVIAAAGVVCRAAAGQCDVADSCDGASAACPADVVAVDGSACTNGVACDGAEMCLSGVCRRGTAACDDGDVCTADSCSEPAGSCTHTILEDCCASDEDCNDGDACTLDTCVSSRCAHGGICSDSGAPMDAGLAGDASMTGTDAGRASVDGGAADSSRALDSASPDATSVPAPDHRGGCGCRAGGRGHGWDVSWMLIAALVARWRLRVARMRSGPHR